MIVDPDFPDHWKTRMLVDLLGGDEAAPVYLIRLWAHCQNRRIATFENLPHAALKALCRYPGHSNKLESALATSGFVRREGAFLHVLAWEEYNASLIANWSNGKKGGRPKKPPAQPLPENPPETHGFPMANPSVTDMIGVDRKEEIERENAGAPTRSGQGGGVRRPTLAQAKSAATNLGITPEKADEWWHAREASEWLKGMAGGGTAPVGTNWQADLKTYASRGAQGHPALASAGASHKSQTKLDWE